MKAMILAGGMGTRLRPLTFSIPKPLLPVGEKPILQIILEQMKRGGVDEIVLATGYHAELIRAFCGDGSQFGLKIHYVHEHKPLGTAGPLALARHHFHGSEPFLLMNGDVITGLDFGAFLRAGQDACCDLTVGYTQHEYRSPFGVLEISNGQVHGITEKPVYTDSISAGIYCVRPAALELIPDDTFFTMPDLMLGLIGLGRKVGAYFIKDCWIGIETVEHFDEAMKELARIPGQTVLAAQQ